MEKKVVLVTGTSSGFGWLIVTSCAALGYKVYATMRNINTTNSAKAQSLAQHPDVEVLEVEVTSANSVGDAVTHVMAQEGRIDVLINNAGVYATGLAESFTEEDMDRVMDVNVKGSWRTIRKVLPHMRQRQEGLIVNISSVAGRFASPFMSMYTSSKFALEALTESLHYEVRPLGVDVVLVQPGAYPTEIFGKIISGSDSRAAAGYGDIANIPEQMGAGMMQLFEAVKPNPQLVADAVVKLIQTPKGKRPLRTVADVVTGNLVEAANDAVKKQADNFLSAYGMAELTK